MFCICSSTPGTVVEDRAAEAGREDAGAAPTTTRGVEVAVAVVVAVAATVVVAVTAAAVDTVVDTVVDVVVVDTATAQASTATTTTATTTRAVTVAEEAAVVADIVVGVAAVAAEGVLEVGGTLGVAVDTASFTAAEDDTSTATRRTRFHDVLTVDSVFYDDFCTRMQLLVLRRPWWERVFFDGTCTAHFTTACMRLYMSNTRLFYLCCFKCLTAHIDVNSSGKVGFSKT